MRNDQVGFDELSGKVIGCAIEVHRELGPGLLESAYEQCLAHELGLNRIHYEQQKPMPVQYKGTSVDCGYRLDLFVEESLLVELKAVRSLEPIHDAQVLTYLKLTGVHAGLLINFNVRLLRDGIRRLVSS